MRGCAEVAATGGARRAHHFTHVKEMVLLPDSNYITWAPSIPCCLLSGLSCVTVRNQRSSEFSFAESKCADTGTNDPGILERSVRSVEPVCFATSPKALFAWVSEGDCSFPKVKHYLRATPTMNLHNKGMEERFLPSERE